jgi:hypothetical protein
LIIKQSVHNYADGVGLLNQHLNELLTYYSFKPTPGSGQAVCSSEKKDRTLQLVHAS